MTFWIWYGLEGGKAYYRSVNVEVRTEVGSAAATPVILASENW